MLARFADTSQVAFLCGEEACCERWGNLLHHLWDSTPHLAPDRLVCRLFIREVGLECFGNERDEHFCMETSNLFEENCKMCSFTKRPSKTESVLCRSLKRQRDMRRDKNKLLDFAGGLGTKGLQTSVGNETKHKDLHNPSSLDSTALDALHRTKIWSV